MVYIVRNSRFWMALTLAGVVGEPSQTAAPGGGTNMKRSLDIAAVALASLLLLGFALLSVRGLIDPQSASVRFGASVNDASGALFYRVYLSRNLVIVAAGAIFLLSRQWLPLAVLVTATAALPVF